MSSAYLASPRAYARTAHPDPARIVALSVAMTVNLVVFVAATRPLPPLATARLAIPPALTARVIDSPKPKPEPPPPPPLDVKPLIRASRTPAIAPPAVTAPRAVDEGRLATPPAAVPTLVPPAIGTAPASVPGPPVEATLAYRSAPLDFPMAAIRRGMHGTVLLRVLVDERGRPVEVVVERGSGYPLLDRSAHDQVLARWRFQPASVDGRPVRAWARVPVSFELRKL